MPARPRLRAGCTELQGLKRKQKNGSKRKQKSARRGRGESKRSLAPGCASPPCPGKLPSSCGSVGMAPGWVWGAPNHGGCSRGVWVLMLRSPPRSRGSRAHPDGCQSLCCGGCHHPSHVLEDLRKVWGDSACARCQRCGVLEMPTFSTSSSRGAWCHYLTFSSPK